MRTLACLAEPRGVIHTAVCGFGFVSHTAKALQGASGFLWGLTEGLPTVPTRSNTLLEALAASSLLRAELSLPKGHLPGSYQLLGSDCCLLGFSLLRFHRTSCPLLLVSSPSLPFPDRTSRLFLEQLCLSLYFLSPTVGRGLASILSPWAR